MTNLCESRDNTGSGLRVGYGVGTLLLVGGMVLCL